MNCLHNFNNLVSCNKSKNQIYIIVLVKVNVEEKGVSLFSIPKTLKGVKKNE